MPSDHGVKTFTNLFMLTTAGSQTITAADTTLASTKGTSPAVSVTPLTTVSALAITGFPTADVSGVPHTFTVTAVDLYGNKVVGYRGTVAITSPDGSAILPAAHTFTAANAGALAFTATLVSLSSGQSLKAADNGNGAIDGSETNIVVASPADKFSVASNAATTPAGQPVTITVKALTAAGQVDTLFQDAIQLTSSDPQTQPISYLFQASDHGVKTFSMTLTTAGSQTMTAKDTTRTSITGTSAGITVTPLAVHSLSVTGYPSPDISGVAHKFVVTGQQGGQLSRHRPDHQQRSQRGAARHPHVCGRRRRIVHIHYLAGVGGHAIDYGHRHAGQPERQAAGHQRCGCGDTFQRHEQRRHECRGPVRDDHGEGGTTAANQIDTLFTDAIRLTSSDGQATPINYTFQPSDHGVKTFQVALKTAGSQTVTVTDTTRTGVTGISAGVAVMPLAASTLSVTGFPNPEFAGVSHTLVVTALDIYGNKATSYRGTVKITSHDPNAVLPAAQTFTAADKGVATFAATLKTVSTAASLTATDTLHSNIKGSESNIDVAMLTAGISSATGVRGQALGFILSAVESGGPTTAPITYRIDWGDGTTTTSAGPAGGTPVSHVFTAAGTYTVKVTATDSAGNVSPVGTQSVTVQAVALEADPLVAGAAALFIGGTTGNDTIIIKPTNLAGTSVSVSINGVAQPGGPFAPTGLHLIVYGQAGKDTIEEETNTVSAQTAAVAIKAVLFAGSGNTTLSVAGSNVGNVLVGGAGNNTLRGRTGADILIGGPGADSLTSGSGGDLLIAGATTYDANLSALLSLLAEWSRTYEQRVQGLFAGGADALNGDNVLNTSTVLSDNVANQLTGGAGADVFWFNLNAKAKDKLANLKSGEALTFK